MRSPRVAACGEDTLIRHLMCTPPPAPDFFAGGFGAGVAAHRRAGSTYGAGLVDLPGPSALLLILQSASSANYLFKLRTMSRTRPTSHSTTLMAVNAVFFCRYLPEIHSSPSRKPLTQF